MKRSTAQQEKKEQWLRYRRSTIRQCERQRLTPCRSSLCRQRKQWLRPAVSAAELLGPTRQWSIESMEETKDESRMVPVCWFGVFVLV